MYSKSDIKIPRCGAEGWEQTERPGPRFERREACKKQHDYIKTDHASIRSFNSYVESTLGPGPCFC